VLPRSFGASDVGHRCEFSHPGMEPISLPYLRPAGLFDALLMVVTGARFPSISSALPSSSSAIL